MLKTRLGLQSIRLSLRQGKWRGTAGVLLPMLPLRNARSYSAYLVPNWLSNGTKSMKLISMEYYEHFPRARRKFSSSPTTRHEQRTPPKPGEEIRVTFIDKDGVESTFEVAKGDNLLSIAQSEDLEMEGACGGSCACSTCHVIVESPEMYDKMPEPDDDENDMLDLAFGLTETSRLGCQVQMTKELDGLRVRLPSMTRNLQASDFSGAKKS